MKWIIIIVLIMIVTGFIWLSQNQDNQNNPSPTPTPTSFQQPSILDKMTEIKYQSDSFRYSLIKIENPQKLKLYPNYDSQTSSTDLFVKFNCQFLINAGFYSEDNQPLGWFVSQKKQIAKFQANSLFNGFLFFKDNQIQIKTIPEEKVDWGVQTGPLLFEEGKPITLKLTNDKLARRMIALLDQNNNIIFIVLTNDQSLTSGPLLVDLPKILEAIVLKENININSAINLDGGMASAYLYGEIIIKEYQPIGSFFCLEN